MTAMKLEMKTKDGKAQIYRNGEPLGSGVTVRKEDADEMLRRAMRDQAEISGGSADDAGQAVTKREGDPRTFLTEEEMEMLRKNTREASAYFKKRLAEEKTKGG